MARHSGAGAAMTIFRFCLSTLPFLAVLVYFLYTAIERGNAFDGEEEEVTITLFSLMDLEFVFLAFHVCWTMFAVYLLVFVPKRRYLLDRYLREGETTSGDVIFEDPKKKGFRCIKTRQYGYAIYSHPTKTDPPVVVRKQVRVYQPYTRERITILRLPNRPLSGQAKIDIEIDLSKMRTERDTTLCYISAASVFWVLFSLAGAGFCAHQMSVIPDELLMDDENAMLARKILYIVAGANPVVALVVNGIRYLWYHNWMVHRGASFKNEGAARNIKASNWSLYNKDDSTSFDGSDQIPYSILGEDRSYAGTIRSHSQSINKTQEESGGKQPEITMDDNGSKLKTVPWTDV